MTAGRVQFFFCFYDNGASTANFFLYRVNCVDTDFDLKYTCRYALI